MGFLQEARWPMQRASFGKQRYNDRLLSVTRLSSLDDLEAVFLDDWVGQDFFGDALELFLGFVAIPTIQIQDEKLPLADVLDGFITEARESVVYGLTLGIENRAFRHDPDMCLHGGSITLEKR
jgi:hypothetical protein